MNIAKFLRTYIHRKPSLAASISLVLFQFDFVNFSNEKTTFLISISITPSKGFRIKGDQKNIIKT